MKIAVVDGQGGGIGKYIVERIRKDLPCDIEIIALGTNAIATNLMLKAGANEGATGENAILINILKVDLVIGTLAIVLANSMLGELTPKMAEVITTCKAPKLLLPMHKTNNIIVGIQALPIPHAIDIVINEIRKKMEV